MAKPGAIAKAMSALKEDQLKALIGKAVKAKVPAADIVAECRAGLGEVGERFNTGEYFISELMYAGEIMKDVMAQLTPLLKKGPKPKAKAGAKHIVVGTVRGDIHDIGKDIVVLMLRGAGYEVTDLGVDVKPEQFVAAVKKCKAFMIGMSVFLTTCCKALEETAAALKKAGLRDGVKIMIGGAAASDMVSERTGCDSYGATAVDAVTLAHAAAGK
ncbi:MAG TPA: cobalamin-dependent protein [Planctomycetota bacterium]|nr:cobalamin-dependent protein [Planctomycetota bacterium]